MVRHTLRNKGIGKFEDKVGLPGSRYEDSLRARNLESTAELAARSLGALKDKLWYVKC